jgi:hypothetical protein
MKSVRVILIAMLAVCPPLLPQAASAQAPDGPARVALVNLLEGHASVQLAGSDAWVDDLVNRPLTSGDRLWIESGARAELHIGASALRLGPGSALQLVVVDDSNVRVRLTAGSLNVRLRELDADDGFIVETPAGELELLAPGGYRIDADDRAPVAHFTVWSGRALARGPAVERELRNNDSLTLAADDDRPERVADAGEPDRLDLWAEQRDQREDQARAAQYLPRAMVGYQELDGYGDWSDDPQYGAVWTPRYVAADWAPFRFGYWSWVGPWGWTWIDDAPWGFAPCHYGNWVRVRHGWAWSPGPHHERRPMFSAAVVSWIGLAPGRRDDPRRSGRIGWAPRGHAAEAGAYTAVTHDTFLAARPVGGRRVTLAPDELRRAPVVMRPPALAPGFGSLGRTVTRARPETLPDRGVFERRPPQLPPARGDGPPRPGDEPRGGDARAARDRFPGGAAVGSGLGNNPPGAGLRQRLPDVERRGESDRRGGPAPPPIPAAGPQPAPGPAPAEREFRPAPRAPETITPPQQREPLPVTRQPGRVFRDEPVREPRTVEAPQRTLETPQREMPREVPREVPREIPHEAPRGFEAQRPAVVPVAPPAVRLPLPVMRAPPPPIPAATPAPPPRAAPSPPAAQPAAQPAPPPAPPSDAGRMRRGDREPQR